MCGRPHDLLAEAAPSLARSLLLLGGAAAAGAARAPLPVLLAVVVGAVVRQLRLRFAQQAAVRTSVNMYSVRASVFQNGAQDYEGG